MDLFFQVLRAECQKDWQAAIQHRFVDEIFAGTVRFAPVEPAESGRLRLMRLYPGTTLKPATRTIVVPAPGAARMGAGPVEGEALLRWAEVLLRAVVEGDPAYETEAAAYRRRR